MNAIYHKGGLMACSSTSYRAPCHDIVSAAPVARIPELLSLSGRRCRSAVLRRANFAVGEAFSSVTWLKGNAIPFLQTSRSVRDRTGARARGWTKVRAVGGPDQSTFLSLEEAGLVEMTNLDMHERFLARLTISSLNLLKVISEQEGIPIEELNAGRICDWFVKDKEKRSRSIEEATLKWDSHDW